MTQHVSHYHSDQIRELHAEIERLTAERDAYHESNERLAAIVSGKNAEIERLRLKVPDRDKLLAEIERLTAALQEMVEHFSVGGGKTPIGKMLEDARRALEPKP
jgi:septal ring factor EnvC (AmiA/AmiB activator)